MDYRQACFMTELRQQRDLKICSCGKNPEHGGWLLCVKQRAEELVKTYGEAE